jgi:hypothetical protein
LNSRYVDRREGKKYKRNFAEGGRNFEEGNTRGGGQKIRKGILRVVF